MSHDPMRTPNSLFPRLNPINHRLTSPADQVYNCVAWAVGETTRWWEPGDHWPDPIGLLGYAPADLIRVLETVGYSNCPDGTLEPGFEKVAMYARSPTTAVHAARQLPSGKWTSKLGPDEDIEHDTPDDVAGGVYGDVVQFLKRPLPPIP